MHNRNMLRLQPAYCDAEFDETLTSNINYFATTTKCDVTRINRLYMQYKRGSVSDLVHRKRANFIPFRFASYSNERHLRRFRWNDKLAGDQTFIRSVMR